MAEEQPAANGRTGTGRDDAKLLFSVIMPAYNEEDVIEATLVELSEHLDGCGFDYEIVVVDDGSQDGTGRILQEVSSRLPRVRPIENPGPGGYGFAIRKGLEVYKGDAMVIVTSDGADSPKDVAAYFRKIEEGYDCAFGSRFAPGATVEGYPRIKLVINRVANRLLALVLRQGYDDYTNGFKCYRRCVVDDMKPLVTGQFNITIELALKAVLGGWRYAVVPNDWKQRDAGQSSFNVLHLAKPYAMTALYCFSLRYLLRVRR
jgi:dolichol-phosphate mannosyltransferase